MERVVAAGFDLMLEEQLLRVLVGPVAEQIPTFDDRPGLLEWRWVEPFHLRRPNPYSHRPSNIGVKPSPLSW
jgi:hypothetical protein